MISWFRRVFRDLFRLIQDKSGLYDRLDILEKDVYALKEDNKRMLASIRSLSRELEQLKKVQ